MKIKLSGNTKAKLERLTWDDMKPCRDCNSLECETAKTNFKIKMMYQNTCIDLKEAKSPDEILKIWSEKCNWFYGFSLLHFYPNPEYYKYRSFKNDIEKNKWESESKVVLEIIPENEDDVLAMNQTLYDKLKGIPNMEGDEWPLIDNALKIWVKNLRDDIKERLRITPVAKKEFLELEIKHLWQKVDEQKDIYKSSFRSIVNEELERIKRGKSLFNGEKLIQDLYKSPDGTFDSNHFRIRIIGSDIAQIVLELERMKNEPPDDQDNKSKRITSFKWILISENELPELYEKMKVQLIASETTLDQFQAIFTGQPIETIEPVEWIGKPVLLAYFIAELITPHMKIEGINHWSIAAKCFKEQNRKTLANLYSQYRNNTFPDKKPNGHEIIDNLFK